MLLTLVKFSFLLKRTQGVPIEVVPFAYAKVLQDLHHKLGSPKAALRTAVMKGKLRLICLVLRLIIHPYSSWTRCYRQWELYYRCSL